MSVRAISCGSVRTIFRAEANTLPSKYEGRLRSRICGHLLPGSKKLRVESDIFEDVSDEFKYSSSEPWSFVDLLGGVVQIVLGLGHDSPTRFRVTIIARADLQR